MQWKKVRSTQRSSSAAPEQSAYEGVDPATVGTITDTVTLEGAPPAGHEITLGASPAWA